MEFKVLNYKDVNAKEIMRMASIGCTQAEIAQKYGLSIATIMNEYRKEYLQGVAMLHETLRQLQWDCAQGNDSSTTMLIFLGKCYLHQQEDAVEEKLSDLDQFLDYLKKQEKCLISPKNNCEVSKNPMPE